MTQQEYTAIKNKIIIYEAVQKNKEIIERSLGALREEGNVFSLHIYNYPCLLQSDLPGFIQVLHQYFKEELQRIEAILAGLSIIEVPENGLKESEDELPNPYETEP